MYSEAVEVRSNQDKFYLRWFRNPACGDWTGSNRTEKDRGRVPPGFFWGKGGEVVVRFRVCGAPWANEWANVSSVDFFFTYGDYGFSLKEVGTILGNDNGI